MQILKDPWLARHRLGNTAVGMGVFYSKERGCLNSVTRETGCWVTTYYSEPSSLQDQKIPCFRRLPSKSPTASSLSEGVGGGRLSGQWAECGSEGIETRLNFATHSVFHPLHETAAAFWKRHFWILLSSSLLSSYHFVSEGGSEWGW